MNLNLTDTRYSEGVSQASSRESEFLSIHEILLTLYRV